MFTYSATDAAGTVSTPTEVAIEVTNVNDAPTVSPSTRNNLVGLTVRISSGANDVDGDDLTYTWTQTAGPVDISFDSTAKDISFESTKTGTYTFTVVANDGEESSTTEQVSVDIASAPDNDSGSMGWLTTLLLPLAAFRRRKMKS